MSVTSRHSAPKPQSTETSNSVFDTVRSDINSIDPSIKLVSELTGVDDMLKLGSAAVALGTLGANRHTVQALLSASSGILLNFLPFGKITHGCTLVAEKLGIQIAEKVFTKEVGIAIGHEAGEVLLKAINNGERDIEALLKLEKSAIAVRVEKLVSEQVCKVMDVITPLMEKKSSKLSKTQIEKVLMESALFDKDEVIAIAGLFKEYGINGSVITAKRCDAIRDAMTEQMTKSMKKHFHEIGNSSGYMDGIRSSLEKQLGSLRGDHPELVESLLSPTVQEKVMKEATEEGIEKGVRRAMHEKFEKLKKKLRPPVKFRRKRDDKKTAMVDKDDVDSHVHDGHTSDLIDWEKTRAEPLAQPRQVSKAPGYRPRQSGSKFIAEMEPIVEGKIKKTSQS
jgi:hypothetical protein